MKALLKKITVTSKSSSFCKRILMAAFLCNIIAFNTVADELHSDIKVPSRVELLKQKLITASDEVMVVAHRSCWRNSAENSVNAVELCIENGIDIIEVDVNKTADGHLVCIHDETVDRTTNGSGSVEAMTLADIRSLRLKAEVGGAVAILTEFQVPLLSEMLMTAKGKILINLDVKADIYGETLELVQKYNMEDQVLLKMVALPNDKKLINAPFLGKTSFMPVVRQCRPEKEGMICSKNLSDVLPQYKQFSPVAYEIVFHEESYLIDGLDEIKKQNKRLWVNTLKKHHAAGHIDSDAIKEPEEHWGHLIGLGANIIQTDNPIELKSFLNQLGH